MEKALLICLTLRHVAVDRALRLAADPKAGTDRPFQPGDEPAPRMPPGQPIGTD